MPIVIGVAWLAAFALFLALVWRLKRRRKYIGGGAAGSVYDMLNEDKRKAVELIVENKTADTEPERARLKKLPKVP